MAAVCCLSTLKLSRMLFTVVPNATRLSPCTIEFKRSLSSYGQNLGGTSANQGLVVRKMGKVVHWIVTVIYSDGIVIVFSNLIRIIQSLARPRLNFTIL